MRIVDLTHVMHTGMPVYPGTPPVRLEPEAVCERDGYRETRLSFCSHVGTHMDAPAHVFPDGVTLDRLPPERFSGRAVLLDCRGRERVTEDMLRALPRDGVRFVLLRTGWEEHYGTDAYHEGFPVLTRGAAERLARGGLWGIGVDAVSVDPVDAELDNHRILLGAGLVIAENLCNLGALPERFEFEALPLLFENADGAPIRAIARTDDE